MLCRIGLIGYARTGKDTAGEILIRRFGLVRVALGDIIKRQLDPLVMQHLGFSAFTQEDHQKKQIRNTLVHWGYANYDRILAEFMHDLPGRCVATRVFRLEEAEAWQAKGGLLFEIRRPGVEPAEPMEAHELNRCRAADLITGTIHNDKDVAGLEACIVNLMCSRGYAEICKEA